MYYDQLFVIKRDLEAAFKSVMNSNCLSKEEQEQKLIEISLKLFEVEARIKSEKECYYDYGVTKESAKKFKKDFKKELLTQAVMYNESLAELIEHTLEYVPNPGINLLKYIRALRNNGYFNYVDVESENSKISLTSKSHRYLENEANISLKR